MGGDAREMGILGRSEGLLDRRIYAISCRGEGVPRRWWSKVVARPFGRLSCNLKGYHGVDGYQSIVTYCVNRSGVRLLYYVRVA